jgi:hypothetical protein
MDKAIRKLEKINKKEGKGLKSLEKADKKRDKVCDLGKKMMMKKIININNELVEVLWIDDNEIEYIPMSEFISKYGQAKINNYLTNKTK